MKKSRFTEEQIVFALEAGRTGDVSAGGLPSRTV